MAEAETKKKHRTEKKEYELNCAAYVQPENSGNRESESASEKDTEFIPLFFIQYDNNSAIVLLPSEAALLEKSFVSKKLVR